MGGPRQNKFETQAVGKSSRVEAMTNKLTLRKQTPRGRDGFPPGTRTGHTFSTFSSHIQATYYIHTSPKTNPRDFCLRFWDDIVTVAIVASFSRGYDIAVVVQPLFDQMTRLLERRLVIVVLCLLLPLRHISSSVIVSLPDIPSAMSSSSNHT